MGDYGRQTNFLPNQMQPCLLGSREILVNSSGFSRYGTLFAHFLSGDASDRIGRICRSSRERLLIFSADVRKTLAMGRGVRHTCGPAGFLVGSRLHPFIHLSPPTCPWPHDR